MLVKNFVAVDIETSGIRVTIDKIIEIGAVKVKDGKIVGKFSKLVNPGVKVSSFITDLTGITDEMLVGEPDISNVLPEFIEFNEGLPLLGHNISFDYSFLKQQAANLGLKLDNKCIDTVKISRKCYPFLESRKLNDLSKYLGVELVNHHRAFDDAKAAACIYIKMCHEQEGKLDYKTVCRDEKIFSPYVINYKVKKQQPATEAQKNYLRNLIMMHGLKTDYDIDMLSKSDASRKIDKILSEYGRKW